MKVEYYPERCRKNIRKLMCLLTTDAQTAYSMMLLTAAMTDLKPEDDKVVELILDDCDLEVRA